MTQLWIESFPPLVVAFHQNLTDSTVRLIPVRTLISLQHHAEDQERSVFVDSFWICVGKLTEHSNPGYKKDEEIMYGTGQRNRLGNTNQVESRKGNNNADGDMQTLYALAM